MNKFELFVRIVVIASLVIDFTALVYTVYDSNRDSRSPIFQDPQFVASVGCSDHPIAPHDYGPCITSITFDDHDGNLYGLDTGDDQIYRIKTTGQELAIAGARYSEFWGVPCRDSDGRRFAARFCNPSSITFDATDEAMLVTERDSNAIRRVTQDGVVSTLASSGPHADCWDFSFASNHVCQPRAAAVNPTGAGIYVIQGHALMRLGTSGRYALVSGHDPLGADKAGCVGHDGKGAEATYCGI